MWDLYWITRLDELHFFLNFAFYGTIGIVALWYLIAFLRNVGSYDDENMRYPRPKVFIPLLVALAVFAVFIPTTKQAIGIYVVGGTIDYVKSNDKIKKLPDKVVDFVDAYLEKYTPEKSDSTSIKK